MTLTARGAGCPGPELKFEESGGSLSHMKLSTQPQVYLAFELIKTVLNGSGPAFNPSPHCRSRVMCNFSSSAQERAPEFKGPPTDFVSQSYSFRHGEHPMFAAFHGAAGVRPCARSRADAVTVASNSKETEHGATQMHVCAHRTHPRFVKHRNTYNPTTKESLFLKC